MKLEVSKLGVAEFALRASMQPGWSILIVEPEHTSEATLALAEELRDLDDAAVKTVAPTTPEELVSAVQDAAGDMLVLHGLDGFTDRDWQHIDLLRSRLARDGSTILLLSPEAAARFTESAPNLSSWLGSTVWRADLGADILSPAETEQRLAALRESTGLTDGEVLTRGERGELPGDPEFAEWLVLLGRGDLVSHG